MSRFAVLDEDEEEQTITTLLRQTSVLAKQGVIDETHKSALKDSILSGDDKQIMSARTLLDELSITRTENEPKTALKDAEQTALKDAEPAVTSDEEKTGITLSSKAKPFVPTQPEKKIVLILRGLPGSGKSSLVKTVAERFSLTNPPWVCSADHFFTDKSGHYSFDLKLLSKAHNACLSKYLDGMLAGERFIVVDNTSSTKWEYENYTKVARIAGYEVQIREIRCPNEKSVRIFAARCTHNVPVASILAMWKRWESDPDSILEDAWMPSSEPKSSSESKISSTENSKLADLREESS